MKKIFASFAMALLLVGCAKEYDDSALQTRIAALETRVNELETSIQSIQSAVGDGVFVLKVQEYTDPDTGRVTGITVTYTNGDVKWFQIVPVDPTAGPVFSVIRNGAGDLVWAVDGVAIQLNGEDVPVYQTPVFSIDKEGNLIVEVDGEEVNLGPVTSGGATLQDGIFTNLEVTDEAVVLTLSDGSTVNIPFAEAFQLVIEQTEYTYAKPEAITIPYTVSGKTEKTVVGVTGYDPFDFSVAVNDDAIVITPLSAKASGVLLAYADSKVGLVSPVNITVEAEGVKVTDEPYSGDADYLAEGEDASVTVNVVSNIDFDVVPAEEWISLVSVKAQAYVITLKLENNTTGALREGLVNIVRKGTEEVVQSVRIAQLPMAVETGPKDLGKKGTANSYIVTEAGDYKFPLVKGNGEEAVAAASAVLLWETWNNADEVTVNSVIATVGLEDGFVSFSTPETLKAGNAVIAAKDAAGTILWSWHIWIPETTIENQANGLLSTDMMDRNLGALVAAEAGDTAVDVRSFGLLYQWGRKDPSVGAKRVSSSSNATVAGEALSAPGLGTMTLEESIQNPTVWYSTENGDWITEADNTLWVDDQKTIYDPCPPGYRVPARDTSMPFFASDLTTVTGWNENASCNWFTMGDPAAVFPFAGYRDDYGVGSVAHAYDRVFIWSAHNNGDTKAYGIDVRAGSRHQYSSAPKSRGAVVRCVVEPAAE